MKVLQVLFQILNIILFIHTFYFGVFAFSGLLKRTRVFEETDTRRHFAVLIPARNEETVIANLVDSISEADYQDGLIDTYVVINNCTDNTEAIAKEHGARIIKCTVPTKNKAEVLKFAFSCLEDEQDIDAYAVFDADNVVDPGFFREVNRALASGAPAVQCRRTGKNLKGNWVSACYEIYYAMQNTFFNHPRSAAGLTASISGTGWVVSKDIIDRRGFDLSTITEDFEMTIRCAMDGDRIVYCSRAVVYDEFTQDLRVSMVQRIRWTFGMLQCLQKFEGRLVKQALKGSWQSFDMAFLNILPLVTLTSLISSVLAYFIVDIPMKFYVYLPVLLVVYWISMSLSSLIAVLKSGSSVKENIKGILAFPLFIITWAPILIFCFFKRDVEWTPIKHDQNVSIEDKQQTYK